MRFSTQSMIDRGTRILQFKKRRIMKTPTVIVVERAALTPVPAAGWNPDARRRAERRVRLLAGTLSRGP